MGKARNVYFRDTKLWEKLEKIAAEEDRSVNYILERLVCSVASNDDTLFRLVQLIKGSIADGQDEDSRSWQYEEGVLLSIKEARLVLKYLSNLIHES